jgi:hypothetical protein
MPCSNGVEEEFKYPLICILLNLLSFFSKVMLMDVKNPCLFFSYNYYNFYRLDGFNQHLLRDAWRTNPPLFFPWLES